MGLAAVRALSAAPAALAALSTGADAAGFDVTTVMQGAVDTTKSQMFSVLGIVVPAIVAIVAAIVGVKFGIGWLKKIRG